MADEALLNATFKNILKMLLQSAVGSSTSSSSTSSSSTSSSDWLSASAAERLFAVAGGGRFVLSAGYLDDAIKAHSVATAQCVGSVRAHHARVTCLALAADQPTTLLTGAEDGSVWRCDAIH